jgi:hypothetical protein
MKKHDAIKDKFKNHPRLGCFFIQYTVKKLNNF